MTFVCGERGVPVRRAGLQLGPKARRSHNVRRLNQRACNVENPKKRTRFAARLNANKGNTFNFYSPAVYNRFSVSNIKSAQEVGVAKEIKTPFKYISENPLGAVMVALGVALTGAIASRTKLGSLVGEFVNPYVKTDVSPVLNSGSSLLRENINVNTVQSSDNGKFEAPDVRSDLDRCSSSGRKDLALKPRPIKKKSLWSKVKKVLTFCFKKFPWMALIAGLAA